jgi:antitoxin component YwqK of YwqJK toxin-antitoxin module
MKKTACFLMIATLAISCKTEHYHLKSDLETANLKGNVRMVDKTIHETDMGIKCACSMKLDCNKSKYIYDKAGNLLKSITIDENGKTDDSTKYSYDRNGVCSEIAWYKDRTFTGREVPVMKGKKVTGYKIYNEKGVLESTLNYFYSGDDMLEERTLNSNCAVVGSVKNEFLNGQLVSMTEKDGNEEIKTINKIKRNAGNDVIESLTKVLKDNSEFKFTFEYEYDNAGNWIKQTKFYNGQIVNIVVRNIEYSGV